MGIMCIFIWKIELQLYYKNVIFIVFIENFCTATLCSFSFAFISEKKAWKKEN